MNLESRSMERHLALAGVLSGLQFWMRCMSFI